MRIWMRVMGRGLWQKDLGQSGCSLERPSWVQSMVAAVSLRLLLGCWRSVLSSSFVFGVRVRLFGCFHLSFQAYVHGLLDLVDKYIG